MADNLKRAEQFASKARADVASIEARIANARAMIAGAPARRSELTLAAATGSAKANDALLKIRTEVSEAEHQLLELEDALPRARQVVTDADEAVRLVVAGENRVRLGTLARDRIALSGEIDACARHLTQLIVKFEQLGHHALVPYLGIVGNSTANVEAAEGKNRLGGALSAVMNRVYPTALIPNKFEELQQAETAFWLPHVGNGDASA